jgi:hypothetical protein
MEEEKRLAKSIGFFSLISSEVRKKVLSPIRLISTDLSRTLRYSRIIDCQPATGVGLSSIAKLLLHGHCYYQELRVLYREISHRIGRLQILG